MCNCDILFMQVYLLPATKCKHEFLSLLSISLHLTELSATESMFA